MKFPKKNQILRPDLSRWLPEFTEARQKGAILLKSFTERLIAEVGFINFNKIYEGSKILHRHPEYKNSNYVISAWNRIVRSREIIKLIFLQKKCIEKSFLYKEDIAANFVVISSKRLSLKGPEGARIRLRYMLTALPGSKGSESIIKIVDDKNILFLIDPQFSRLWDEFEYYSRDNIFIVDYYYLIYTLIASPIFLISDFIYYIRMVVSSLNSKIIDNIKTSVFAISILSAFRKLESQINCRNALFLTSNSYAAEIFRIFLLESKPSVKIYEILHGIPSLEFEEYFENILSNSILLNPHEFISQIKVPAINDHMTVNKNLYINIAMNQYLLKIYSDGPEIKNSIIERSRDFSGNTGHKTNYIVSFMGATSHDKDFFSSETFYAEVSIMRFIQNYFDSKRIGIKIFYSPHPAVDLKVCERQNIFMSGDVVIYPDTKYMWIIADIALSLYSSALFDAYYGGMHVFTPMTSEDCIYSKKYLSLISHPEDGESCILALERFLKSALESPPGNYHEKINARLNKWINLRPD
jgi:hypothetical protein